MDLSKISSNKKLRYLRSVQGGAREAASTTERLVQVKHTTSQVHNTNPLSHLFFAKTLSNLPLRAALQRHVQMIPELHECMEINYNKRIIGLEAESTTIS